MVYTRIYNWYMIHHFLNCKVTRYSFHVVLLLLAEVWWNWKKYGNLDIYVFQYRKYETLQQIDVSYWFLSLLPFPDCEMAASLPRLLNGSYKGLMRCVMYVVSPWLTLTRSIWYYSVSNWRPDFTWIFFASTDCS